MDYWIAIDRQKIGPMSLAEVRARRLSPDTLVWHNGLSTWCKASSLPELAGTLSENDTDSTGRTEEPTDVNADSEPTRIVTEEIIHDEVTPAYVMPPEHTYHADEKDNSTPPPPMPRSYIGWSIAAIILCCTIPAIVSLIYSCLISPRYNAGNYQGAQKASETSEIWLIVSIVFGLVWLPFGILISMF